MNTTDALWESTYRSVYTHPALQIPWYAVLGNHDYHQNPEAQIQYTQERRDNRWIMPSHLYHQVYSLPTVSGGKVISQRRPQPSHLEDTLPHRFNFIIVSAVSWFSSLYSTLLGSITRFFSIPHFASSEYTNCGLSGTAPCTLEIVFLDTCFLSPNETVQTRSTGVHAISLEQQRTYLEQVRSLLAQSEATWLLVAGHYTVYSMAEHGDNNDIINSLAPLLEEYHVQAYLHGHDHVLQHIQWRDTSYVASGHGTFRDTLSYLTGSFVLDRPSKAKAGWRFGSIEPGFGSACIFPGSAETVPLSERVGMMRGSHRTQEEYPGVRPKSNEAVSGEEVVPNGGEPLSTPSVDASNSKLTGATSTMRLQLHDRFGEPLHTIWLTNPRTTDVLQRIHNQQQQETSEPVEAHDISANSALLYLLVGGVLGILTGCVVAVLVVTRKQEQEKAMQRKRSEWDDEEEEIAIEMRADTGNAGLSRWSHKPTLNYLHLASSEDQQDSSDGEHALHDTVDPLYVSQVSHPEEQDEKFAEKESDSTV